MTSIPILTFTAKWVTTYSTTKVGYHFEDSKCYSSINKDKVSMINIVHFEKVYVLGKKLNEIFDLKLVCRTRKLCFMFS